MQHAYLFIFFLIRPITFLVYRIVLAYVVMIIDAKALEYFLHPDLWLGKRILEILVYFFLSLKGSSELYADKLKAKYLGDVPIYSPFYAATEGLLGINLWPKEDRALYMLVPRAMFYEFIPVEESSKEQPTVCMKQCTSKLNPFLKLLLKRVTNLFDLCFHLYSHLDISNANLSIEGNLNLFKIRRSCVLNNGGPICTTFRSFALSSTNCETRGFLG